MWIPCYLFLIYFYALQSLGDPVLSMDWWLLMGLSGMMNATPASATMGRCLVQRCETFLQVVLN